MSFKSIAVGLLGALVVFGLYKFIWDSAAGAREFIVIFIIIEGIVYGWSILKPRADD